MKRMYKIGALILSAAVLLSCSACSKGVTSDSGSAVSSAPQQKPYEVYLASTQKMSALTSTDSDFTVDMTIEASGSSTAMKTTGNAKTVTNGTDVKCLIHSDIQMLGQTVNTDCYFADNYLYVSAAGQKIKQKMDLSTFMKSENQNILSASYPEKDFDSASITNADGDTTIQVILLAEDAQKIFDSVTSSTLSKLGSGNSMKFQYSDISLEVTVNSDGYVKTTGAKCTVTMSLGSSAASSGTSVAADQDIKMDMTITNTYNNPGQSVTITPPSDLSVYKESNTSSGIA